MPWFCVSCSRSYCNLITKWLLHSIKENTQYNIKTMITVEKSSCSFLILMCKLLHNYTKLREASKIYCLWWPYLESTKLKNSQMAQISSAYSLLNPNMYETDKCSWIAGPLLNHFFNTLKQTSKWKQTKTFISGITERVLLFFLRSVIHKESRN